MALRELAEMANMAEAGVVAFSDDGHHVENAAFASALRILLQYTNGYRPCRRYFHCSSK